VLDVVLALDRVSDIVELLEINQPFNPYRLVNPSTNPERCS
jgi:hypothetical protein